MRCVDSIEEAVDTGHFRLDLEGGPVAVRYQQYPHFALSQGGQEFPGAREVADAIAVLPVQGHDVKVEPATPVIEAIPVERTPELMKPAI